MTTRLLVLVALLAGFSLPVCAQEWPIPGRPIRVLNPFPPGMPKPLVAKINATLVHALRSPEISKVYQESGFIFLATSSEEHAAS